MATSVEAMPKPKPLEYLPISLFGSTMGLTGLSVAWKQAHDLFAAPLWVSDAVAAAAVVVLWCC